jgi:NADPH2:quinone reductase
MTGRPEQAPANIDSDVRLLKPSGTIAIYAANPGESVIVPIRESMTRMKAGALRVGEEHGLPLTRFPLQATAAAHDAVEQGTIGKVFFDVAPPA